MSKTGIKVKMVGEDGNAFALCCEKYYVAKMPRICYINCLSHNIILEEKCIGTSFLQMNELLNP